MYWTYLLRCADGTFYAGHTDDLERRLAAHQQGVFVGYTRSRRPVMLVWAEEFTTRDDAFRRERQIKGWSRAKKLALIAGEWDALQDLAHGARDDGGTSTAPPSTGSG